MNHLREHLPMSKGLLKCSATTKGKGIKSLIESSFKVANNLTDKNKSRRGSKTMTETQYLNGDVSSDEDDQQGVERHLSKSISLAQFQKLQSKRKVKVVAVFPDLDAPQIVLQELRGVCKILDTEFTEIKFENLDYGEYHVLNMFYNADVCVVDMSVLSEQPSLFYHIGVRESTGMKDNVVIVEDNELGHKLQRSISSQTIFFSYHINTDKKCIVSNCSLASSKDTCPRTMHSAFVKTLRNVQGTSKAKCKEIFLRDLRKAMQRFKGPQLKEELDKMKKMLDEPALFSSDTILNLLYSYRDIQDYDAMIQIVETVPENHCEMMNRAIQQLYAFALNRRASTTDRDKALTVVLKLLSDKEVNPPDLLCLAGRIYKDKYYASKYMNENCRDEAIKWYKTSFEIQPSDFSGCNLAIMLVAAGHCFLQSDELQRVCMTLNGLIGRRGHLQEIDKFWIVGRFILISVLAQDYNRACLACERMFLLNPPSWYLKSIIQDLEIIKLKTECHPSEEELLLRNMYWNEVIYDAATDKEIKEDVRFVVLLQDPGNDFIPSYIIVDIDTEDACADNSKAVVRLWHAIPPCGKVHTDKCKKIHSWSFRAADIRGISAFRKDNRCLFLYVHNSDDFQLFFCTPHHRKRFQDLVGGLSAPIFDVNGDDLIYDYDSLEYEYEYDPMGQRVCLGRGSFGTVYAARDLSTNVKLAVKEIPEKDTSQVQPLHEEIALHREINHKNIVRYIASRSEGGVTKIFMEQVPGGSLSTLIREKWGPMIDNEGAMSFYTQQIVEGVRYLHGQKIVHRDIKGDNVLVNTYNGCCKLTDFGTSKRLAGINPHTKTFAGTMQFMAPEVIDQGQRGYGPPADIWSIGCTVIEMATGKPPFFELEPEAAIFKVGMFKTHPEIPDSASEECVKFLKRCFDPNPNDRMTAEDLLMTSFIQLRSKKKKMKKETNLKVHIPPPQRIISDPGPSSPHSSDDSGTVSNNSTTNSAESPSDFKDKIDLMHKKNSDALVKPTADLFQKRLSPTPKLPKNRFNSEPLRRVKTIDSPSSASTESLSAFFANQTEYSEFSQINQEHERKMMLVNSMKTYKREICDIWMKKIDGLSQYGLLNNTCFNYLLEALIEYVEQGSNCTVEIKDFIGPIQRDFPGDDRVLQEIQLAFHLVAECISEVIRDHMNVLPHWIFLIDDLIRNAVKRTIDDISKELLSNDDSASLHSAGDSTPVMDRKVRFLSRDTSIGVDDKVTYLNNIQTMSDDSLYLLQELSDLQTNFNKLLKTLVTIFKKDVDVDTPNYVKEEPSGCEKLLAWLRNLNVPEPDIAKFCEHYCTYEDVIYLFQLDDLKDMKISVGPRTRIWTNILKVRASGGEVSDVR